MTQTRDDTLTNCVRHFRDDLEILAEALRGTAIHREGRHAVVCILGALADLERLEAIALTSTCAKKSDGDGSDSDDADTARIKEGIPTRWITPRDDVDEGSDPET